MLWFCDVFVPAATCRASLCPEPLVSPLLLSLYRVVVVSLCQLRVFLRVRIRILSRAFAKVVLSDAFDAKASFSLDSFGAALFSCILCVCWDKIPKAC